MHASSSESEWMSEFILYFKMRNSSANNWTKIKFDLIISGCSSSSSIFQI